MPSPTILVVDDEQLIRWSLTSRLTDEGYRVFEADTAAAALKRVREGVDLVLLDYRLPDSDGLAVLKQIKENDPDTLVIMSIRVAPTERPGEQDLILEHATVPLSPYATQRFKPYWLVIKPTGAFVSRELLKAIGRRAESASAAAA